MSNVDLNFCYHGCNREDSQYGLHPRNQPVEAFSSRKIWTRILAANIFIPRQPMFKKVFAR